MKDPSQPFVNTADILIIDDIPENIRFLANMLEQHGYRTRKATSGEMGLRAVEMLPPSLILLDIRMPKMNGYEVCRQFKANPQTANIPIIFLSAADDVSDKIEAFAAGGADYVTKPFHLDEVLARVKHQLTIVSAQHTIAQLNTKLEDRIRERTAQLELANSQLTEMAFFDPLTHLANRALLMNQLHSVLEQQKSTSGNHVALLYLDCDRFKVVNDSLGHLAGDELLIIVANRLKSILREGDFLARLGGDEFVILLNASSEPESVLQIAERILSGFSTPLHFRARDIFLSFSIGIILDCANYQAPEDILRDADTAMYQAKISGKDRYKVFEPSMHQAIHERLQLEMDLRKAIQHGELSLYYQPVVDLSNGHIVSAEALLRWHHPTRGWISPEHFIPIAEETGFILKLGHWVLKEASRQLKSWQTNHLVDTNFSVSVNVSACQFAHPRFVQDLDDILAEFHVSHRCLGLEITETVIMENFASATQVINQLRERCIKLSIDDFGTGYSSLGYLHSFPVDILKIDRSFIQRLHDRPANLGLVTAITHIAKAMEMSLVAEGIETNAQLTLLKQLECQFGQGYLFAKPLHPTDLELQFLSIQCSTPLG